MAAPVVEATTDGVSTSSSTTVHTITFPSGSTSGDLIVICFANAVAMDYTLGDSFAQLLDANTFGIFYKQINGTEGGNMTVTTTAGRAVWTVYRISGHADPGTQAPQIPTTATGDSNNPDPPSISPTGGSKDYLFIAAFSNEGEVADTSDAWMEGIPANYGTPLARSTGTTSASSTNRVIGSAHRTATTATENPGTFTVNGTAPANHGWQAQTIAIHPAASGTNNSETHTAPVVAIAAGTHTARKDRRPALTAPAVALAAGTHAQRLDWTPDHTAPTVTILAGDHLAAKSKLAVHTAPEVAVLAGSHAERLDWTPDLTAPAVAIAAGTHAAVAGRPAAHTAPTVTVAAGTHAERLDWTPDLAAPVVAIAAGTHALHLDARPVHTAPVVAIAAGTHSAQKSGETTTAHTAPDIIIAAGTHAERLDWAPDHTAPQIAIAAGTHTAAVVELFEEAHTAPEVAIAAGTHLQAHGFSAAHTAPVVVVAAGTHAQQLAWQRALTAPQVAIAAGTHSASTTGSNFVAHAAPETAIAAGAHIASRGSHPQHTAPQVILAAGAHLQQMAWVRELAAGGVVIGSGVHTALYVPLGAGTPVDGPGVLVRSRNGAAVRSLRTSVTAGHGPTKADT